MEREEAINLIKQVLPCLNIDEKIREGFETLIPELKENEDERIRKNLIELLLDTPAQDIISHNLELSKVLAYLEKQKEQKHPDGCFTCDEYKKGYEEGRRNGFTAGYNKAMKEVEQKEQKPECDNETEVQKAYREGKNAGRKEVLDHPEYYGLQLRRMYDYETGERNPEWSDEDKKMLLSIINAFRNGTVSTIGQEQWLKNLPERFNLQQKPAESDAIKGGDFISDGKRVFLVLANVKERNLGETDSTFCEGHILGVDGVVYCDGDNFKKFKRATSDERAKFIHDLKVGVELKEQPAQWSEEDEEMLKSILFVLESYVSHSESASSPSLITSYPIYYKEIDWLKSLRPSWKLSEEQMEILQYVCTQSSHPNQKVIPVLESLYNDLKKL